MGLQDKKNNSGNLACVQLLLSLKLSKDYYILKKFSNHSDRRTPAPIGNFLKNLYRDTCIPRIDPQFEGFLDIASILEPVRDNFEDTPLNSIITMLFKSSLELEKNSLEEFKFLPIQMRVQHQKKMYASYISKLFGT